MFWSKNCKLFSWSRFKRLKLVTPAPKDRLRMGPSRPVGAISMQIAFLGTCWTASWNRTGDNKLFTWYAAELCWAIGVLHPASGMLELIQRAERFFGLGIIRSSDLRSFGPASAMYGLWNATPLDFTALANTLCAVKLATTFATESLGPEI